MISQQQFNKAMDEVNKAFEKLQARVEELEKKPTPSARKVDKK